MTKTLTARAIDQEEPTNASFHFSEKSQVQPVGLECMRADQAVTLVLEGKVSAFNVRDWDNGKSFTVQLTSCKITTPMESVASIDDALKAADKHNKRMK
jgi:hypothetical protein